MTEQTMELDTTIPAATQRVVEFELRRPTREDLQLPKVDLEPVRQAIEDVALTSIGLAIIGARSLVRTWQAARQAGREAAADPGPITRAVLDLVHYQRPSAETLSRGNIPVLPIADYDALSAEQLIARLTTLTRGELGAVRDYELEHARRTAVLKAIDGLLETAL
ncbi:MAG: hypothetical protein ACOX2L_04900 [Anaerolineae bacterium]|jgi:hypothetical protein|nr:hypothetical protein [Chloroflexota bacterium]